MHIKVTNINDTRKDQPLVIRADNIVSVFTDEVKKEDNTTSTVTVIFGGPFGHWHVKESVDEVYTQLNRK